MKGVIRACLLNLVMMPKLMGNWAATDLQIGWGEKGSQSLLNI